MTCFKDQFLLTATVVTPLLFAATETTAQTAKRFVVKGVVADAATKEGEQYATMKITSQTDSTSTAALAVSEADGTFNMTLKKAGSYRLFVNAMGKQPIVRNFVVSDSKPVAALDTLYIKEASHVLGAVEIVAQKPLVKADIDKITYDIEEDPDSKTNNILEMLRKVPMVTVDGDSNIKVNGSSGFKVYVNGRPNNMMSKNPKEVLKSMPASSIKKVEVITNPGPKYDAEGVGGILNIVTVGKGIEGYTVTTNGGVSNADVDAGMYATVKQGKLTVSGTYSYNYYDGRNMHNSYSVCSRATQQRLLLPTAIRRATAVRITTRTLVTSKRAMMLTRCDSSQPRSASGLIGHIRIACQEATPLRCCLAQRSIRMKTMGAASRIIRISTAISTISASSSRRGVCLRSPTR